MGNVVIDSRDRNRELVDSLHSWMERRRQDRQLSEQRDDADRRARITVAQAQLQQIDPSQRGAFVARLPEDVRGFFNDPGPLTPSQQADQLYGEHKLKSAQSWEPTSFDQSYMNMEGVIGRNPNTTWSEAERDRSFMTPEVFKAYADEGFVAPSEAEKNRAAAGKDIADAEFTKGPKTSTEYAQGSKYRAETGKVGAETTKIREETTTERELRDPNSPATKARTQSAGRKTTVQQVVEDHNSALQKLDEKRTALKERIAGEEADLAANNKTKSPDLARAKAELQQTEKEITRRVTTRDKIITGAGRNGVSLAPSGDSSAAPKKGDRKTFPNGKVGEWDGVGWVMVGG